MSTPQATRMIAALLATSATATAVSLSVVAGWQRGGTLPERFIWIAIGVVLVVSAHLLPALARGAPFALRGVAALLWIASMATTVDGHSTFFLLAQQHAGALRAETVSAATATAATAMTIATTMTKPDRGLAVVMRERADMTQRLAFAGAQRCSGGCSVLEARRVTLAARRAALDAEADALRRQQADDDRATAQREALLADPVTSRLAALLGTTATRVDLLSGLAFAVVLEGVACLLWAIALRPLQPLQPLQPLPVPASHSPAPVTAMTQVTSPQVTAVAAGHEDASGSHESPVDPVTPAAQAVRDDLTRLQHDIAAGCVRATVADIRRYLGCSQARAILLRRQIAEASVTA